METFIFQLAAEHGSVDSKNIFRNEHKLFLCFHSATKLLLHHTFQKDIPKQLGSKLNWLDNILKDALLLANSTN